MRSSSWKFLLALFSVTSMLEISAWGHMEAFTPLFLSRELGVGPEEVPFWTGILAAMPLAVAAPLSPFWGVLADRYNRKVILLRTLLVGTIAYGLAAVIQDVWQFMGLRLFMGLIFGGNAIVVATIASLAPDRRLGLAVGVTQMMFPVGKSVGPLVGSALINLVGLRGMFAVDAVLTLIAFVLVLFLFKEPPRKRLPRQTLLGQMGAVMGVAWRTREIRLTFLVFFLFTGGMALVTPFLPVLIDRVYEGDDPAMVIGVILAVYGGVAAISAPVSGRLADQLGPVRIILFNMLALATMSVLLVFVTDPLQVGLVVLLGAVPFGAGNTALYSHLARYTPREHMSGIMSLSPLPRNTSMLVAPLLGSFVVALGLDAVFILAAATYLLALGVSLLLERRTSVEWRTARETDSG